MSKKEKKRQASSNEKVTAIHRVKEWASLILVPLLGVMILNATIVKAYHVPTGSMRTTIEIGDNLLVNRFIYGPRTPDMIPLLNVKLPHYVFPIGRDPKPGEIIVFTYPVDQKTDYVKRCMAVPGQTLEIKDDIVYIDGKPEGERTLLRCEYDPTEGHYLDYYQITRDDGSTYQVRYYNYKGRKPGNYGPVTLPEGQYFAMGDNRDNSADSRYWGFVPRENITGKPLAIYFSWNEYVPFSHLTEKIRWGRIGTLLN